MNPLAAVRDFFREPVLRLVTYHVGFIILAAGLILGTEYYAEQCYKKPAQDAIANQNGKHRLAQIIQRQLQSIESRYRALLLFDNPHRIEVLNNRIDQSMVLIDSVIDVLKTGGTMIDVMPVNFYDADEIREEIRYRRRGGEQIEVAVLDIAPKIEELKQSLSRTTKLLLRLLAQGDSRPVSHDTELIIAVKQTDALLLRTRECANKIFYDIRQSNLVSESKIARTQSTVKKIELSVNLIANTLVVVLAFIVARKIYHILKLQKSIQAHNNLLSTVVDQSPASIVVTDTEGKIEYVNTCFVEQTGYGFTEIQGQTPRIFKTGDTPSDRFSELWQTISGGGIWRGELINQSKNGRIFTEDAVIAPVLDEKGRIIKYAAIKFDITEKKQLADSNTMLRIEQNRLKAILDYAPIGVIISTPDKRIIWANEFVSRITGTKSLENLDYMALLPVPVDGDLECLLSIDSGKKIPILRHCRQIVWGDTEVMLTTFVDLSRQKKLEADLAQKNKLESVGSLAAGIAHEINTPIQFISHNLTFLQDSFTALLQLLELTEKYRRLGQQGDLSVDADAVIKTAREEADMDFLVEEGRAAIIESIDGATRISAIVKSIKAFSHPGSTEKSTIDMNQLIRDTLLISKNEWKNVADILVDLPDEIPRFLGLLNELQQVMLNLVMNARDAIVERRLRESEHAGRIEIRSRLVGDWIEIMVQDNGSGIREDIREQIFDPFFTTKDVGKGTGQGLSISRNIIVRKHQGELYLTEGIDGGAGFLIRLPLVLMPPNGSCDHPLTSSNNQG